MPLRTRLQNTVERFVFAKRYELPQALQTIKTEGISQPDLESFIHRVIENVEDALSAHIEVIRDYSDLLLMVNAHPQLRTARRPIWTVQDLLTPVFAHDEVFAVIRATRSERDKDFDSDDSDFLIAVAEPVGIAATHFRLRREKQEAEYALEIQRALLPREVPQFSGFTIVCNSITTGKFITFVYAVLDSSTQTLTYVNAGHNPPIIVRPDADCITLEAGGTVLGMFPTWPYEQATIHLQPNDQLVIFTDGVTEASSPEGDEFGEDRLIDLLQKNPSASATHLRDVIMHGVTQFCREDFADDATLLVVAVI
jgi:serine phosphatase RsbU (regulator of sigma subunit)